MEIHWTVHESRATTIVDEYRIGVTVVGCQWVVEVRLRDGPRGPPMARAEGTSTSHELAKIIAKDTARALLKTTKPASNVLPSGELGSFLVETSVPSVDLS